MKIFLILKSSYNDSNYFIRQISAIRNVEKVIVFRDRMSQEDPKVDYITNQKISFSKVSHLLRLIQIVSRINLNPKVIIGIYEIPHGLLAVLAGKILKKPCIVSIIGNPAYSRVRKGLRLKVTNWIFRKARFVTVTGYNSRKYLIDNGLPPHKVVVLPNSMDFKRFFPVVGVKRDYDVISLGRLSKEKRVDQIIRVIYLLKKNHQDIKVAIGGDGPEKGKLEKLIKSLNLERNIKVLGYVSDNDLPTFLSKGKVFLLTSETEGFPRTIIQAAACGAAVVATNVGDISDIIEHNVDGFLVDNYTDIMIFNNYIQLLLSDLNLRKSFVNRLDYKVRTEFANKKATRVWESMFDQIN
jgi:glycosyltransferase involved in cell wall biosynthesis